MGVEVEPVPRWDWSPLPGGRGIVGRVLFSETDFFVSVLRFGPDAAIDEHADARGGTHEVICLEGSGFTSVGDERSPIQAGQRVTWPPGLMHGLWTEGEHMVTLMVGRYSGS